MDSKGKGAVLITGASTGIGRACALSLDQWGYKVFAGVRRIEDGQSLQQKGSDKIFPLMLDITDSTQISKAVGVVTEVLGPHEGLSALVNNAGIVMAGPLESLPVADLRRQFEVNVIGHIAVIQAFLPLILLKEKGRIINICSAAAFFAAPFLGAYAASKFAMAAATDSIRRELSFRGIKVSIIHPGYTETSIWDRGYDQADRLLASLSPDAKDVYASPFSAGRELLDRGRHVAIPPEAVARRLKHAIESRHPKTRYLVGTDTCVVAIAEKLLPACIGDWLVRKLLTK